MKSLRRTVWRMSAAGVWLLGLAVSGKAEEVTVQPAASAAATIALQSLPRLPYPHGALEPFLSARTVGFHYGKHHQGYVDNLNKLTAGTALAGLPLEKIIAQTFDVPGQVAIFNNAAQVWNHTFFWQSMKQGGGGKPKGKLLTMIEKSFGSFDKFKEAFTTAALAQFGSGWVWLVQNGDTVKILTTSNADTPIAHGQIPLLTCDVWEHAYYLDYQNRRKDFVQGYVEHLANWDFATSQVKPWPE